MDDPIPKRRGADLALSGALRNPDQKCAEFKNSLPDERKLHRFARDREFLEKVDQFEARLVQIPDIVADTESNLTPLVLQKILYRLGFQYDQFKHVDGDIHFLLNRRNAIAHGVAKSGLDEATYVKLRDSVYNVMDEVGRGIMQALQDESYLRKIAD